MEQRELTENEKKKLFLNSYLQGKRAVKRLEEQLAELRINKLSPSGMIGDGMPHGNDLIDLSGYAAQCDELEREIVTARYRRIEAFMQVQRAIEEMEDEQEKLLLTYRYIRGMKWEKIATEMDYKWRSVHKIHARALKNFKVGIEMHT